MHRYTIDKIIDISKKLKEKYDEIELLEEKLKSIFIGINSNCNKTEPKETDNLFPKEELKVLSKKDFIEKINENYKSYDGDLQSFSEQSINYMRTLQSSLKDCENSELMEKLDSKYYDDVIKFTRTL